MISKEVFQGKERGRRTEGRVDGKEWKMEEGGQAARQRGRRRG